MRVSVFESDTPLQTFDIYLDDVLMEYVVSADEELGVIVRAKRDDDGNIVVRGDQIEYESLRGKVEIL